MSTIADERNKKQAEGIKQSNKNRLFATMKQFVATYGFEEVMWQIRGLAYTEGEDRWCKILDALVGRIEKSHD